MNNTRLSTSIHLLTELAFRPDETVSSKHLADKMNTHAVVVRRLVGDLKEAGIVTSTRGATGGVRLSMAPQDISLGMLAEVVEEHLAFETHSIPVSVNTTDLFSDAVLSTIETERRKTHTAAQSYLDGISISDVLAASILRKELTALVSSGLSDNEIKNNYQIVGGHLVQR